MNSQPGSYLPLWIALLIVGGWLAMSALAAVITGWTTLASHYRTTERPVGKKIRNQVTSVGYFPEHNVTGLIPCSTGLYLYVNPLFRLLHPPVLVPWADVRHLGSWKFLWIKVEKLGLGDVTSIHVERKAWAAIEPYLVAKESTRTA